MSYYDTPPLTLFSARDLIEKFRNLQSDFYILKHQFGQEPAFKDFVDQGYVATREWVNVEDCLCKLAANAEKRLPTGRNPTQAELQDFVNAYGRFEYLKDEFIRIRKQLEGRSFLYQPAGVKYLIIGNQAPREGDMRVSRTRSGTSRVNLSDYSTAIATGPSPLSKSPSQKESPAMSSQGTLDDKAESEKVHSLEHRQGTSSTVDASAHSNTVTSANKNRDTRRRLFASDDAVPSPGVAAKIANHAPRGIGYSPNEIEAGLHLMNERQHLDIIKGLQDYIDEQNEKIEDMAERLRDAEAAKKKMRGRQNDMMQRVKELTEELGRQADPAAE